MGLGPFEKCAGRAFREAAEGALQTAWAANPGAVPCAPQVKFFRHECPAVKGRTRAVRLEDMVLTSPEIWVTWDIDQPRVIMREETEARMRHGGVVEFEIVLAGKFSFTYKSGKCGHCDLPVLSQEGVLRDERPDKGIVQDDIAVFAGTGPEATLSEGTKREHDIR